jgi:hypothetical protein
MNDPPSLSPAELDAALRAVEADYPGWHAWLGTIPMYYARLPKSSPPIVVRSPTLAGLRTEIENAQKGLRSW